MRVSYQQKIDSFMQDLNRHRADMYRTQQVMTSQREVDKPSDDPMAARKILQLNDELGRNDQFSRNISSALTYLSFTENELQNADELLIEARSLAIQGANETMSASERAASAERVDQILHELVSVANARHGDRYLFGGFNTQESPYDTNTDPVTGDVIQVQDLPGGMDGVIYSEIGDKERVQMNIPGTEVFQTGAPGAAGDMFDVLIDLRDGLRNDDSATIQNTITRFDDGMDRVAIARARLGGIVNRLENMENRHGDNKVSKTAVLEDTQDADIAEWIQKFELQKVAMEMAMQAGIRSLDNSLLSFLGK